MRQSEYKEPALTKSLLLDITREVWPNALSLGASPYDLPEKPTILHQNIAHFGGALRHTFLADSVPNKLYHAQLTSD
jgi:hypothetical protein